MTEGRGFTDASLPDLEALLDDRLIGEVHDPLARALAFGARIAFQLYRGSSFLDQPVDHRRFAPCDISAKYHGKQRNSLRGKEPTALPLEVI